MLFSDLHSPSVLMPGYTTLVNQKLSECLGFQVAQLWWQPVERVVAHDLSSFREWHGVRHQQPTRRIFSGAWTVGLLLAKNCGSTASRYCPLIEQPDWFLIGSLTSFISRHVVFWLAYMWPVLTNEQTIPVYTFANEYKLPLVELDASPPSCNVWPPYTAEALAKTTPRLSCI